MSFNKSKKDEPVVIGAKHAWHSEDEYIFYLTKQPSPAFTNAQKHFLSLPEVTPPEESVKAFVEMVAQLMVSAPKGFSDFIIDDRPLAERFKEYFCDPEQPELEPILVRVWREYKESAVPSAYLIINREQEAEARSESL